MTNIETMSNVITTPIVVIFISFMGSVVYVGIATITLFTKYNNNVVRTIWPIISAKSSTEPFDMGYSELNTFFIILFAKAIGIAAIALYLNASLCNQLKSSYLILITLITN